MRAGAASLLAAAAFRPAPAADGPGRPNIVLFMVDDMGWQDTSLPFWSERTALNERYRTPNMERLARRGVKFTSAYACSISSPTRCSLLTGMNQARHRVTNWTLEKDRPTDEENAELTMPPWNVNGIQPAGGVERSAVATSFVSILRQNGYRTIHCGKAHFGAAGTPGADPAALGFDVNIAGHAGGGLASYLGTKRFGHDAEGRARSPFAVPGLEAYWDKDVFVTEALTVEALRALERNRTSGQPFFLYMSHYAVHVPIEADKRFLERYKAAGLDDTEAAYATLIEGMDKSLGDIMDYLEETGQADNTIIIFMSDNGGLSALGRGAVPEPGRHNAPLRGGKGSVYEGGVREPMIVSWKGVTRPGTTVDDYLIIEDFFPSILEMAGVEDYETVQTVDGVSFVPLLRGEGRAPQDRCIFWNTPNTWISGDYRSHGVGQTASVRRGDYKLVYWYRDGKKELFDVRRDIGETTDLSASEPALVGELSAALGEFLRSAGGQRPSFRMSGNPCAWPDGKE